MKILDQPDTPGYYWWRERPEYKWHLGKVTCSLRFPDKLLLEFFEDRDLDYGRANGCFYGEWVKAEINEPDETGDFS